MEVVSIKSSPEQQLGIVFLQTLAFNEKHAHQLGAANLRAHTHTHTNTISCLVRLSVRMAPSVNHTLCEVEEKLTSTTSKYTVALAETAAFVAEFPCLRGSAKR